MKDTLVAGLTHRATIQVTPELTVPGLSGALGSFADMPPVLATAMMIGFTEATCIELLAAHLDPGERSVGIHVDLSHQAPTPVGMTVVAVVTLEEVRGRLLTFGVELRDDREVISTGTHRRAVIDESGFMKRLAAKQA